jgi:hypothetical protein
VTRTIILGLALVSIALTSTASAQTPALSSGVRIRWRALEREARIGTVVGLVSDTLVAIDERDTSTCRVPLSSLEGLDVSKGRPNRAGRYALVGGLAGGLAAIGVLAVLASATEEAVDPLLGPSTTSTTDAGPYVTVGLIGAAAGAVIGGAVGAASRQPERWEAVELPRLRLGLGHGAAHLSVALR